MSLEGKQALKDIQKKIKDYIRTQLLTLVFFIWYLTEYFEKNTENTWKSSAVQTTASQYEHYKLLMTL